MFRCITPVSAHFDPHWKRVHYVYGTPFFIKLMQYTRQMSTYLIMMVYSGQYYLIHGLKGYRVWVLGC